MILTRMADRILRESIMALFSCCFTLMYYNYVFNKYTCQITCVRKKKTYYL